MAILMFPCLLCAVMLQPQNVKQGIYTALVSASGTLYHKAGASWRKVVDAQFLRLYTRNAYKCISDIKVHFKFVKMGFLCLRREEIYGIYSR